MGTALLRHVLATARRQGTRLLWCAARQHTLPFYQRFGLAAEGVVFYKDNVPCLRLSGSLT
ncbi:GNAT family N-acetyltransferase [Hymenobacter sp. H14-R3]|uniref:GNAT family N-acetyltransferase n=1 Tax=Hymenobacter sp. H14-R3 TaxID=3046308 RepID=UPI0024BBE98E|nr:GNAT family N-acetyltransferase [Hymenobacter sp. H14-R3]MDJ0366930.1 GNAT family N-acetyltransferase [Hymenobacter sp. H14-R3]